MKRIIILLLLLAYGSAEAREAKIVLFYPRSETFWDRLVMLAEEAASDLNMAFKAVNGNDNHVKMRQALKQILEQDKPDVVVFNNFKGNALNFIKMTHEANVHAFLINSDIDDQTKAQIGGPRGVYPHWIGQMLPGEEEAGIKIAEILSQKAKIIVGVNGVHGTGAAIMRENALRKVYTSTTQLRQVVFTNQWAREPAAKLIPTIYSRYPNLQGVWGANFSLTLGVVDGIQKLGLTPGKDLYVVGYDIPSELLQRVHDGKILATTGGHFIEGAWSMVVIHDYLNGIDPPLSIKTPMAIVTQDNAELYLKKVTDAKLTKQNIKKINFKMYSKKYNGGKPYNFSLDSILEQL